MPKVSVIVPVYKAEAYLGRCVDSLRVQTLSDIEIILVDDGSPDRSGAMCDAYAAADPRIRVIHQPNGGVSSARNAGLDAATGEYVIHCDPDDWVDPEMYAEMYAKAISDNADMVICGIENTATGAKSSTLQHLQGLNATSLLKLALNQKLHCSLCNKLIKHSVIHDLSLRFIEKISLWEDFTFICELLLYDMNISILQKAYYHYDTTANLYSIAKTPSYKAVLSQIESLNYLQKRLAGVVQPEDFYCAKSMLKQGLIYLKEINQKQFDEIFCEINPYLIDNSPKFSSMGLAIRGHLSIARLFVYLNSLKSRYI